MKNEYLKIYKNYQLNGEEHMTYEIYLASEYGHLDIVMFLISIGKIYSFNAIKQALKNFHFEVAKYLQDNFITM